MVSINISFKCGRCGKCCSNFYVTVPNKFPDDEGELMSWRGITIDDNVITVPAKCKYLAPDNSCSIYRDRPRRCREFRCS